MIKDLIERTTEKRLATLNFEGRILLVLTRLYQRTVERVASFETR